MTVVMYQTIDERIDVVGVYQQGGFKPVKFRWRSQLYHVDQITLRSEFKDGGVKKRQFSVVSGGNVYRLVFDRDNETWQIAEVWCE